MDILISLSLKFVGYLVREALENSNQESNHVLHDLYENSLELAENYLKMTDNQEENRQFVQMALNHLETAYSTKYTKNTQEENDLILSIIRLHHVLQSPYSVIRIWSEKFSSAGKVNDEIKDYLTPDDYGCLIARLNGFDEDIEDDLEEIRFKKKLNMPIADGVAFRNS